MCDARVIGKIFLSEEQTKKLLLLGVSYIAEGNPKNRADAQEIISRIGDAEAIIINISTPITEKIITECKHLRFIQTWSTGTDNIDLDAANKRGIIVKNVPDFSSEAVAEKTLSLMIFIANHMREANQDVVAGNWNYLRFQGVELKSKVLAIIGSGKIGSRVAELAKAFGMTVLLANSKTDKNKLRGLCSQADFITVHCPLTKDTYHLIGEEEFNAMSSGVYFINNSRGGVVDENALLNALNRGIISYASIDVLEQEPPEGKNPLIHHPKVFVTPHITWNTKESTQRLTDECIVNLTEYILRKRD